MRTLHPVENRLAPSQGAFGRCLKWLTANLLTVYLLAITAQQLWALLNSDVKELVRRLP